jgi:hypothetical protein
LHLLEKTLGAWSRNFGDTHRLGLFCVDWQSNFLACAIAL